MGGAAVAGRPAGRGGAVRRLRPGDDRHPAGVSRIVEIGAVRMRGFEAVDEFERLVDPGVAMPATITRITGLETRDLRGAPRIERVLPEFLEFAAGAVLVAHNASFDVGFVDAELSRLRGRRLAAPVIDTVMLARRLLAGRLPRMNLGTLAERFDTEVRPCHRALPDAQATARCWRRCWGWRRSGVRGRSPTPSRWPARRGGRCAAAATSPSDVPRGPGVYLFRDGTEHVLYVGKATDLRARVRSYFSGPPQRRAVEHALAATERVETRPLGSELEAALVELELIGRLRPPANSRNAHPERACYLTLTHGDPVPRLARHRPAAADLRARSVRCRRAAARRPPRRRCASAFGIRSCRPAIPDSEEGVPGRRARHLPGAVPRRRRRRAARGVGARAPHLDGDGGRVRAAAGAAAADGGPGRGPALRGRGDRARPAGGGGQRPPHDDQAAPRPRPQRRAAGPRRRRPLRPGVRRAPAAWWSPAAACRAAATAGSRSRRWWSRWRPA